MSELYKIIVGKKDDRIYYRLRILDYSESCTVDIFYPKDIKYLNDYNLINSVNKYFNDTIDTGIDREEVYNILLYHMEPKINKHGDIIITTWIEC